MKKVLFIIAAALMTMTQCKKQDTSPAAPAADTIKMTVTAGPGRTDIGGDGSITWSKGDKLYVSDGTNWLGSLTLVGEGGSTHGTFTGSIAGIGEGVTTCHFFYLGHDNGGIGMEKVNSNSNSYPDVSIDEEIWEEMEECDVVFLPAPGNRQNGNFNTTENYGNYWSSTCDSYRSDLAYRLRFTLSEFESQGTLNRLYGYAVRLVRDL